MSNIQINVDIYFSIVVYFYSHKDKTFFFFLATLVFVGSFMIIPYHSIMANGDHMDYFMPVPDTAI